MKSTITPPPTLFIDTHCHINLLIQKPYSLITKEELRSAEAIIQEAHNAHVTTLINVGTDVTESINSIELAKQYPSIYASVGIHPNDLKDSWAHDLNTLVPYLKEKRANKIVAIGECGLDTHYPGYNLERQKNAFREQIELALEHDLALIVHTREAPEETLLCLEPYRKQGLRGTIHCFSEDLSFAQTAISYGFVLGLGGTVTYPKNHSLRLVATTISDDHFILETDTPFLAPQIVRGTKNHPKNIPLIAQFIASLRSSSTEMIAQITTHNAQKLFTLDRYQ